MKILFVDMDGVLNCANNDGMIEPRFRQRFNDLIASTGVKCVLISTWRTNPNWQQYLTANGLADCFIGATPILQDRSLTGFHDPAHDGNGITRLQEIDAWLNDHPEVSRYAILDDNMTNMTGHKMFVPDAEFGLLEHTKQRIASYFNE